VKLPTLEEALGAVTIGCIIGVYVITLLAWYWIN